ncbi:hypothetical protein ABW20_dc0107345 [Dactylellina cionopaga]|nr:hypothetical protein ABW20_dc0107345 [Dactylellina cionopaga]
MFFSKPFFVIVLALPMVLGAVIPKEKRHHEAFQAAASPEIYKADHVNVGKREPAHPGHAAPQLYPADHVSVEKREPAHPAHALKPAGVTPEIYA